MEPSPQPLPEGKGSVIPGGCKSRLPEERPRVRGQKKKRATILTFAAIPRQFPNVDLEAHLVRQELQREYTQGLRIQ